MVALENGEVLARIAVLEVEVKAVKDLLGDQKDCVATLDGKLDQLLLREAIGTGAKNALSKVATALIASVSAAIMLILDKVLFRE